MLNIREKLINGELPEAALTAIATMTFPLPVEDFLQLFPVVYERGDKEIRTAVVNSVRGIRFEQLSALLGQETEAPILGFYLELAASGQLEHSDDLVLAILSNPACPEDLMTKAAGLSKPVVLEWLINNHKLLQDHAAVIRTLQENQSLSPVQRRKLEEYFAFGIVGDGAGIEETISGAVAETVEEEQEEEPGEALVLMSEFQKMESEEVLSGTSDIEIDEDMDLNTYQRLLKMTVSDKIQRALKGNKEERTILIRDSNRTVALAVMESPKLTEQEVEAIAAMRNVHRDVIRKVGSNRKFLKKYKVVLNLVKNPKTPQDIGMGLLHRLTDRDLQLLTRDRTISEFLRRSAQRILRGRKKH